MLNYSQHKRETQPKINHLSAAFGMQHNKLALWLFCMMSLMLLSPADAANLSVKITDQAGVAVQNAVVYVEPVNKTTSITPTTAVSIEQKGDRKSTRLNSSHVLRSRMPSSA